MSAWLIKRNSGEYGQHIPAVEVGGHLQKTLEQSLQHIVTSTHMVDPSTIHQDAMPQSTIMRLDYDGDWFDSAFKPSFGSDPGQHGLELAAVFTKLAGACKFHFFDSKKY